MLFFKTTINIGSALGFSYKGYSTNISDYSSFRLCDVILKADKVRKVNLSQLKMINSVLC